MKNRSRQYVHYISLVFILISVLGINAQVYAAKDSYGATGKEELIFGFLPAVSAGRLLASYGPLVDHLSSKLNKPIRIETAPGYAEFVNRTNHEKRYDLLFTAPHFYYLAQREASYRVIARVDAPEIFAIIVAPKQSDIHNIADLKGRKLSIANPLSLATVLTRSLLINSGIDPDKDITLVATPTHNASLLSAHKQTSDAASLMPRPFKRSKTEIKEQMRIIARTEGSPHMSISVSPDLPARDAQLIEAELTALNNSDEGRKLLKHMGWPGFVSATPEEYDVVEKFVKQTKLHNNK